MIKKHALGTTRWSRITTWLGVVVAPRCDLLAGESGPIRWLLRPSRLNPTGLGVLLLMSALLASYVVLDRGLGPVDRADSTADWLVVSALAESLDPYTDLRDLAQTFDAPYWEDVGETDRVVKAPRTPGALIVLYPLSWLSAEQSRVVILVVGWVATVATFAVLWKATALPPMTVLLGAAFALVSGPARWSSLFVTQSPIVMLCVAVALVGSLKRDSLRGGVAVAIAASLKAFPAVLVVLLAVRRRYRALAASVGLMALMNLAPLLLPNMSFSALVDAFRATTHAWIDITPGLPGLISRGTAVSFPMVLVIAAVLVGMATTLVVTKKVGHAVGALALLSAALLAMPLSWPHYLLALIPPLVLVTCEVPHKSVLGVLGVGVLLLAPMTPIWTHTLGLAVILIGITATALLGLQTQSRPDRHGKIGDPEMVIG